MQKKVLKTGINFSRTPWLIVLWADAEIINQCSGNLLIPDYTAYIPRTSAKCLHTWMRLLLQRRLK
jgi:hypothetical protein